MSVNATVGATGKIMEVEVDGHALYLTFDEAQKLAQTIECNLGKMAQPVEREVSLPYRDD